MIDRKLLVGRLDAVANKALTSAIHNSVPLVLSKLRTAVGNSVVEKTQDGYYNILSKNKDIIYADLSVYDAAIIIAQRYNLGETSLVRRLVELDKKYSKHRTDMMHYRRCLKSARQSKDFDRMYVLEDKFHTSELLAKKIKNDISIFKRTK